MSERVTFIIPALGIHIKRKQENSLPASSTNAVQRISESELLVAGVISVLHLPGARMGLYKPRAQDYPAAVRAHFSGMWFQSELRLPPLPKSAAPPHGPGILQGGHASAT